MIFSVLGVTHNRPYLITEHISLDHSFPLGSWQQVLSCSQPCQDWPFYTTPGLLPARFFDPNQCAFLQEILTERNCLRKMNSQSLTSVLVKVVWLSHQALPPQRHGWWVKLCLQHFTYKTQSFLFIALYRISSECAHLPETLSQALLSPELCADRLQECLACLKKSLKSAFGFPWRYPGKLLLPFWTGRNCCAADFEVCTKGWRSPSSHVLTLCLYPEVED